MADASAAAALERVARRLAASEGRPAAAEALFTIVDRRLATCGGDEPSPASSSGGAAPDAALETVAVAAPAADFAKPPAESAFARSAAAGGSDERGAAEGSDPGTPADTPSGGLICAHPDKRGAGRRRSRAYPGRGSFSRPCRPDPAAADAAAAARSAAAGAAANCVCPGAAGGAAAQRQGAAREQGPAGQGRRDPDTGFSDIKQRRARGARAPPRQPAAALGAPAAARRTRRALWRGPFCTLAQRLSADAALHVQARVEQGKARSYGDLCKSAAADTLTRTCSDQVHAQQRGLRAQHGHTVALWLLWSACAQTPVSGTDAEARPGAAAPVQVPGRARRPRERRS